MSYKKIPLRRIVLILLTASCTTPGQQEGSTALKDADKTAIYKLLPEGIQQIDMMDHVTMPPRTQELMEKMQRAAQKNPDWFLEAKKQVEESGQPLPYDEHVGMTESEYRDFIALMQENNGLVMTKSGTEQVTIKYSGNKITFANNERLELLNRIVIDLTDFSLTFGDKKLTQMRKMVVPKDDNGLKSSWTGYEWRYEDSNKEIDQLQTTADYSDLTMTIHKVIVAQLHNTQKTYMHVQYTRIENGK
jgi:hypothetical protein